MNPITSARVTAGLSKHQLEKKVGITRTCILRSEEGCYDRAPTKLKDFSVRTLEISNREFERRYQSFRSNHRKDSAFDKQPLQIINRAAAIMTIQSSPVGLNQVPEVDLVKIKTHLIFKEWREDYYRAILTFCQAFCVHPASVANYEKGQYKSMPDSIVEALTEVNLIDSSFDPNLEEVWVRK